MKNKFDYFVYQPKFVQKKIADIFGVELILRYENNDQGKHKADNAKLIIEESFSKFFRKKIEKEEKDA